MSTAKELLNFNLTHTAFVNAANTAFTPRINRLLETRLRRLEKIIEKIGESSFQFNGEGLIPEIFNKFKTLVANGAVSGDDFKKTEVRTLAYSLSYSNERYLQIFNSPLELDYALDIFTVHWRDSYLLGLIRCHLQNWETKNSASSEKLGTFIINKLKKYDGQRSAIKSLRENIHFFDVRNGDVVLGRELGIKKWSINKVPNYTSLPDSWFVYPYFSKVILSYYETRKDDVVDIFDDLESALKAHNKSDTHKTLISKLIVQANDPAFAILQDKVKAIAFGSIGDPSNTSNWKFFENASEELKWNLEEARVILNEWITRQFINIFFEKCINDKRRRRFWIKYAKKISAFKVIGPRRILNILRAEKGISEYVNGRFQTTPGSKDVSAFMILMGNHVLIEFSDPGYAFYAYNRNSMNAPKFDKSYSTIDELRSSGMPKLVYREHEDIKDSNEQGSLSHSDGKYENGDDLEWETLFSWWIRKYTGVNV
jgi:hypothetical protein